MISFVHPDIIEQLFVRVICPLILYSRIHAAPDHMHEVVSTCHSMHCKLTFLLLYLKLTLIYKEQELVSQHITCPL